MKRRTNRGSVMVFVVLVVSAVTITAVAGLCLTGSVSNNQSKLEKSQELNCVVSGASELASADLASGALAIGGSKTYYVGGNAVTVTVSSNPSLANTANLAITGSSGALPVSSSKTVAFVPTTLNNLWSYGIFSNGSFTWPLLGTNKITGSAYFKNSISILGTGQITKDFRTSSSFNPLGLLTIGGAILTGLTPMTFPTPSNTTYQNAATTVLAGNQTLNGYTFPVTDALVVVTGTLNIKGTLTGDGTIYATGNVTVSGNIAEGSSHHVAIVTPGTITFTGSGSMTVAGYFYAGGTMTLNNALTANGALVANSFASGSNFTVTWDPWLTQSSANGKSLHVPGMWP